MRLKRYLALIYDILHSGRDLEIEQLFIREVVPDSDGLIEGRVRFWDKSMLDLFEVLEERGVVLVKTGYAYHYQDSENNMIFRYDNAPHHPEVSTSPHHKHTTHPTTKAEDVISARAPHLTDVLREIRRHLAQP